MNQRITFLGYGDYYPTTWEGKLLFVFFALIAIPLMLTLLARCGNIFTSVNNHVYSAILRRRQRNNVSTEALSLITMSFIMIAYLHIGVAINIFCYEGWTYVDSLYFWMVTFTTVGFGDKLLPLDGQIKLIPYRLFGLSLVAGIIDSLVSWMKKHRAALLGFVPTQTVEDNNANTSLESIQVSEKSNRNSIDPISCQQQQQRLNKVRNNERLF